MAVRTLKHSGLSTVGKLGSLFGYTMDRPFFIIGSGRCGTTLLVDILNSSDQLVSYPTEANELWHPHTYPFSQKTIETTPYVEGPKIFTEISIQNWPARHGTKIRNIFTGFNIVNGYGKTFFVKSAMISFLVPRILSIFPDARFIHIYRNGPSVVESFLKKEWHKYNDYFEDEQAYRRHCARYWKDCLLEIEKQKHALSLEQKGILFEFSYESLCNDPDGVLKKLADFISVDVLGFNFDTSKITSRNYKVGDYTRDEKWDELMEIMSDGMKLKGYV